MPFVNPTFCKCGELWESPCKCPEEVLSRFSHTIKNERRVFYFDTFHKWMVEEFGGYDPALGNTVLNLGGVVELGADMYQTPYEA